MGMTLYDGLVVRVEPSTGYLHLLAPLPGNRLLAFGNGCGTVHLGSTPLRYGCPLHTLGTTGSFVSLRVWRGFWETVLRILPLRYGCPLGLHGWHIGYDPGRCREGIPRGCTLAVQGVRLRGGVLRVAHRRQPGQHNREGASTDARGLFLVSERGWRTSGVLAESGSEQDPTRRAQGPWCKGGRD